MDKPLPALLSINQGERPYKCLKTEWLTDEDGPLMFRFVSKLRADNRVELVFFTQRQDNRKYVLQHISFGKDEFPRVVHATRSMVWKIFPKAKVEVEDFAELSPSAYRAMPNTRLGLGWIAFMWRAEAVVNKLRWLFLRKPPK